MKTCPFGLAFLWLVLDPAVGLRTADAVLAPEAARLVTAEEVVRSALAYSLRRQAAQFEVGAARARVAGAAAEAGVSLAIDAQASRYDGLVDASLAPGVTIPGIEERYAAGVSANQPLWTGGRVPRAKESAESAASAALHTLGATENDVRGEALQAYWSWAKSCHVFGSLQKSIERLEAHVRDIRSRAATGLATDRDVLATEVQLDRTRLRLEDARRADEISRAVLGRLTGRMPGAEDCPEPPGDLSSAAPLSEEQALALALDRRPERAAARASVHAAEQQVEVHRSARRPRLGLVARWESGHPNSLFFPPEEEWNSDVSVGVGVSWELWDAGRTQARVAEAAARAMQARLRAAQVEDDIRLEVRQALIQSRNAAARAEVAARARASARRNLEAAESQWRAGLLPHSDRLDAEADLTAADYEITSAQADVRLAQAALARAIGRAPPEEEGPSRGHAAESGEEAK